MFRNGNSIYADFAMYLPLCKLPELTGNRFYGSILPCLPQTLKKNFYLFFMVVFKSPVLYGASPILLLSFIKLIISCLYPHSYNYNSHETFGWSHDYLLHKIICLWIFRVWSRTFPNSMCPTNICMYFVYPSILSRPSDIAPETWDSKMNALILTFKKPTV